MAEQQDPVPTPQQYAEAFRQINLTDNRVMMLRFNYYAPERTITATKMAHDMGWEDHKNANLQYGGLGSVLEKKLRALGNVLGEKLLEYGSISTLVTLKKWDDEWHWIMRSQVASALEMSGLCTRQAPFAHGAWFKTRRSHTKHRLFSPCFDGSK